MSLEAPDVRQYAHRDPRGFLADHARGAILDEVQRVPELLSYFQGEVDARTERGRFILTGSANFSLLQGVTQSLAGRTALLNLLPLGREELRRFPSAPTDLFDVLWRGAYPALFKRELAPSDWYASYVGTYVERDVRQLLNVGDLTTFQTFLQLCAGRSAQLLNLSALGADAGVKHGTARSWLGVLEASFVAFRLPPFHARTTARLVKSPKLHLYDTGLVCFLLGIHSPEQLAAHPLWGAIFATWVATEIMKARVHRGLRPDLFFYRDRKGAEVDLVVEAGESLLAVETKSGRTVADDFFAGLDAFCRIRPRGRRLHPVLVYGGEARQRRGGVEVLPWEAVDAHDWT